MTLFKHLLKKSPIGEITIVYREEPEFQLEEIILSTPKELSSKRLKDKYEKNERLEEKTTPELNKIIKEINNYFDKKDYKFSLKYLNLDKLTDFQKKVLIEDFKTKKGQVLSYKDLARKIRNPKAVRAVGTALSKNPYPIIIPCHRIIKSDHTIGGFAGIKEGITAKKTLLEIEGIEIKGEKIVGNSSIMALGNEEQTRLNEFEKEN